METQMEEEAYSRVLLIIIGIVSIIVIAFVLDILTGGSIVRRLVCSMVWYLPLNGRILAGYIGCGGIPL